MALLALISGHLAGDVGRWLGDRVGEFSSLQPAVKVSLLQTLLAAAGGIWAFRLYRLRRESQSSLRIDGAYRIDRNADRCLVFVRLHIVNSATVMIHDADASVSLFEVGHDETDGTLRFDVVGEEDPWLPVRGDIVESESRQVRFEQVAGDLEPRECIQSEAVFKTRSDTSLLGLRVTVTGAQGTFRPFRRQFDWGWFAFIQPSPSQGSYSALSIHDDG